MKCPKCGEEFEAGHLYCPKCLEEIPWVPEYHTVETIRDQYEYSQKKRIQRIKNQIRKQQKPLKKRKRTFLFFCCLFFVLICGIGYYRYDSNHSYAHQYHSSEKLYKKGKYQRALERIDRAITLDDSHEEAYCLLSDILRANGNIADAIKVAEACLETFQESTLVYETLISLYEEDDCPEKIKELMDNCRSVDIRSQFKDFITPDPEISHDTGSYGGEIVVKISGECDSYRYTLDGKTPTADSTEYTEPLFIGEGTTELNVIGYNALGIPSDTIYRKYIIAIKGPDPPIINPESASYDVDTEISIVVPEGCSCYYAFDEIPTTTSTLYQGPVKMPEGTHTLYAFLVGANGKESEIVSKTYTLEY